MAKIYRSSLDPSRTFATAKEAEEYEAQLKAKEFREGAVESKELAAQQERDTVGAASELNTLDKVLSEPSADPEEEKRRQAAKGSPGIKQHRQLLSETAQKKDVRTGPLPDVSQFAKGTQAGDTVAGEAIRDEQAFTGIEGVVEDDKDKDVIKRLTDAGRYDDAIAYLKQVKQASPEGNRFSGGRGSEIKYTIDNPDEVKEYETFLQSKLDQVDAEGKPTLTVEDRAAVEGLIHTAGRNIFEASRNYDTLTRNIAQRLTVLKKGIPFKVELAEKKKDAVIKKEHELKDVSASTEAAKQYAKTAAATRSKLSTEYALASEGKYNITGTEAGALARAGNAVESMEWMADQIEAGNVDWIDITEAGKYKNPEAFMNNKIIGEYYARPLSGAAINEGEWKTFRKEVLTVAYLQTDEGKKAAVARLRDLSRNRIADGSYATKDFDWYDKYQGFSAPSQEKTEPTKKSEKEIEDEFQLLWD